MVNTHNFLLISRQCFEATQIKSEIERNKLYKVTHAETAPVAIDMLMNNKVDCLVFNFDSYTVNKKKLVSDLRELGNNAPTMVFASYIQSTALKDLGSNEKVVAIEKPFEPKDVWGVCTKFVQGIKVNQRIYRRFYTNQSASLEKTITGEVLKGKIFNMSRGGVYLELLNENKIRPGDMFKLTVDLDKVKKTYNVDAEVVWASPKGIWTGKPAVGLKFLTTGDVYRNLLDKL